MNAPVYPVLLCGGSGTRLWPLSRQSYPKQFSALHGSLTLFQQAALRFSEQGFAPPVVVTNTDFRFIVTEQLAALGIEPAAVLLEPEGRNTAPAVLVAALHVATLDPDALMLVTPSDHLIDDRQALGESLAAAMPRALAGQLVTFGVPPTCADTGFGYLELAEALADGPPVPVGLTRFVEKPSAADARYMLASGLYLWNAGIFFLSVEATMKAFEDHAPQIVFPVRQALSAARKDLGFHKLDARHWQTTPNISFDYAVLEHATNLSAVPLRAGWSDLGTWGAVSRKLADDNGNALSGRVAAIDCHDTLLRSEASTLQLVGLGLSDVIAVAMPDAVLVADASKADQVALVVEQMGQDGVAQATTFPRAHRPWGWFETLTLGDRFQVKRLLVQPGAALSLQSHVHRSEHWIVVQGTAEVTIGDSIQLICENQSVFIPLGRVHRLANPGKVPVILIEVQTGAYLGEDDIVRYEDDYARNAEPMVG